MKPNLLTLFLDISTVVKIIIITIKIIIMYRRATANSGFRTSTNDVPDCQCLGCLLVLSQSLKFHIFFGLLVFTCVEVCIALALSVAVSSEGAITA